MTGAELSRRPGRFETFLSMMINGELFLTRDGEVTIPVEKNTKLVSALKARDAQAYDAAFVGGVQTNVGSLTSSKQILKTRQFGGFAGRERSANLNELEFVKTVVNLTKSGPITIVLGNKKIKDVTNAISTGTSRVDGQTSKADVILDTLQGEVKVSIKMKTADYYLSGDALLAPIVGPIVKRLLNTKMPNPRVIKTGDLYMMVSGVDNGKPINMSFEINRNIAHDAVFGSGKNTVDLIVKGDLTVEPEQINPRTYMWNVDVYSSVEELPELDQPIGLLRSGEAGRGFTYKGIKYAGLRPAIATKKRAARAVPV